MNEFLQKKLDRIKDFKIVIPSYNRHKQLESKTLQTLKRNNIDRKKIHIFVANEDEREKYFNYIDGNLYGQIIIGVKGIRNQRIFISKYFENGDYLVSCDDDIEDFYRLKMINNKKTLETINNIEYEIIRNFIMCNNLNKYLWGVQAHKNAFWMTDEAVCGLYFCVGVFHGYINRHDENLYPNELSETKEDYEQVILFCIKDKGVIRRNDLCFKTVYNAPGGLGQDRFERNKIAQEYLSNKYPEYCYATFRKNKNVNTGMPEIRLKVFKKKKL
tara:strand:+ start:73 stop:891 length:819 start_codon:yes stop_codon:yes gene_type:complete